jgi:Rrf2 family protein
LFSQTVEYALRAVVHLASLDGKPVNSESIAAATRVPQGYLSKVMRDLVVAGIVLSQRGPRGGFTLARDAQRISILEVVNAVDPIHRIRRCPLGNPAHAVLCPLHRRLDDAAAQVENAFRESKIAELLQGAGPRRCGRLTAGESGQAQAAGGRDTGPVRAPGAARR